MPLRITDSTRANAIEKNRFFVKAILPFYKRDFNLTDPLFEEHFANTKTVVEYMDYFKVPSREKWHFLEKKLSKTGR